MGEALIVNKSTKKKEVSSLIELPRVTDYQSGTVTFDLSNVNYDDVQFIVLFSHLNMSNSADTAVSACVVLSPTGEILEGDINHIANIAVDENTMVVKASTIHTYAGVLI